MLASVDGAPITQRDFDAEQGALTARQSGTPSGVRTVVERLIDRAVTVHLAERDRLHLSPEYLAAERRGREDVLIALFRASLAGAVPAPAPGEVDRFIAAHPALFAQREQLVLDQLAPRVPPPATLRAPDMATLEAALTHLGQGTQRSTIVVDSGTLEEGEAARLRAVPIGRVLRLGDGRATRFVAVVARTPVPVTGAVAHSLAAAVMRRSAEDAVLAGRLAAERQRVAIRYRRDVSPAAAP